METHTRMLELHAPENQRALLKPLHDFYRDGLGSFSFDETVSLLHYLNKIQHDLEHTAINANDT